MPSGTIRGIRSDGRFVSAGSDRRTSSRTHVAIDEQHVALPKLYGAPAYARPAAPVAATPRPFDPDDLPIEAVQTDEEREIAADAAGARLRPGGARLAAGDGRPTTGRRAPCGIRRSPVQPAARSRVDLRRRRLTDRCDRAPAGGCRIAAGE